MIDLRSDTLTQPTRGMRAAMAAAPVGDDVYAEDPTINALEERVAGLLGHEAGLFSATGSLANLLGVRLLVEPGQEVVCDVQAHIARAELGAHAAVHGLSMRTFRSVRGRLDLDEVARDHRSRRRAAPGLDHGGRGGEHPQLRWRHGPGPRHPGRGGRAVPGARPRLPPGRRPAVERPRGHRDRVGRLRAALRHRQRLLLQGSGRAGRLDAGQHGGAHRPGPGAGASDSAAGCGRPASWPPGPATRSTTIWPGWPTTMRAAYAFAAAVAERDPSAVDPDAVPTNIVVVDTGSVPASAVARQAAEQGVDRRPHSGRG